VVPSGAVTGEQGLVTVPFSVSPRQALSSGKAAGSENDIRRTEASYPAGSPRASLEAALTRMSPEKPPADGVSGSHPAPKTASSDVGPPEGRGPPQEVEEVEEVVVDLLY